MQICIKVYPFNDISKEMDFVSPSLSKAVELIVIQGIRIFFPYLLVNNLGCHELGVNFECYLFEQHDGPMIWLAKVKTLLSAIFASSCPY